MFNFLTGSVSKLSVTLKKSFDKLPVDPFQVSLKKPFRYRKFTNVKFKNHSFDSYLDGSFYQTQKINRYVGGKLRIYKSIDKLVIDEIILLFKKEFQSNLKFKSYELGIHQIRIISSKDIVGYPVPEGWHKDGFDFVILLNINTKNIPVDMRPPTAPTSRFFRVPLNVFWILFRTPEGRRGLGFKGRPWALDCDRQPRARQLETRARL